MGKPAIFLTFAAGLILLLFLTTKSVEAQSEYPECMPPGTGIALRPFPCPVNNGMATVSLLFSNLEPNTCYLVERSYGWDSGGGKNWAEQEGGRLCAVDERSLDGLGTSSAGHDFPDNNYNYLLSDSNGRLELRSICENLEGIRLDCSEEFHLNEVYGVRLWKVPLNAAREAQTPVPADSGGTFSFRVVEAQPPVFFTESEVIKTAFGDIHVNPAELATDIFRIAVGIAGGVAFLLLVYGSYRLMFSAGNPESVQQGREIITAAIIGLIIIVFSVFILRLIGIGILGLPL